MRTNKIELLLLACSFMLLLLSCDKNRVLDENAELPDNVWNVNNVLKFELNVTDTLTLHNFYINVRNADGYPYSNLYMTITTGFPDGRTSKDTLECILANDKGEWLGDGLGDIWDSRIPFKKGVRFPKTGTYTFQLQHLMRTDDLPLLMDVGLRIEKMDKLLNSN